MAGLSYWLGIENVDTGQSDEGNSLVEVTLVYVTLELVGTMPPPHFSFHFFLAFVLYSVFFPLSSWFCCGVSHLSFLTSMQSSSTERHSQHCLTEPVTESHKGTGIFLPGTEASLEGFSPTCFLPLELKMAWEYFLKTGLERCHYIMESLTTWGEDTELSVEVSSEALKTLWNPMKAETFTFSLLDTSMDFSKAV